jgi:hypothetical protein
MNAHTRLATAFNLQTPDRPPILGGWLAAPEHIIALTGCTIDDYWADTFHWGLEAERALGSDGIITIVQPVQRGDYRIMDEHTLEERAAYDLDSVLADIAAHPSPEELRASFDFDVEYTRFKAEHAAMQARCGEMLWCPADWDVIPTALWYARYGYELALTALAAHPDQYRRLIQFSAERGRQHAMLRAQAIRDGWHPRAMLTGEDICSQRGPMCSPKFLRREYFPLLEYAVEPLVEVGAKLVWHCDGDVRPILNDVLACGFAGLQGFQSECGMDLDWIVDLKTRASDPLLIFGPMSVTTTLPHGTPDDVRAEVKRSMEICRGEASLVFFTSNTILPDTPLENLRAYWQAVLESRW